MDEKYINPPPPSPRILPITPYEWIQCNHFRANKKAFEEWVFQNNRNVLRTHITFRSIRKGTKTLPVHGYIQLYEFFLKHGVDLPDTFDPLSLFEPITIFEKDNCE